jgi:hypothetical protein
MNIINGGKQAKSLLTQSFSRFSTVEKQAGFFNFVRTYVTYLLL